MTSCKKDKEFRERRRGRCHSVMINRFQFTGAMNQDLTIPRHARARIDAQTTRREFTLQLLLPPLDRGHIIVIINLRTLY